MSLLKSLATPVAWVLLLMAVGLILTRFGRGKRLCKIGWWSLLVATMILLIFSLEPVANWLVYSLEYRWQSPSPESLGKLDVVVVLGGGLYPSGRLRQQPELARESYPRLYRGVEYFQNSSAAVIAFCGGSPRSGTESEAETMRGMAVTLGVPEEQILIEPHSHNTMTNATKLAGILPPGEGRRIGLVTSATHMLRSKWVFEQVFPQDTIVPMPVYFTYNPAGWTAEKITPGVGHLERSTVALHEWLGILWYAVRY